jgi:NAD(P)-dependent dehydrogenase (short-subunit alcohol dehydrogenase family)
VFFDVCLERHEVVVNKRSSLVIAVRLGFQPSTTASGRRGAEVDEQRLLLRFGFRECRVSVFQPMYFHRRVSFSVIVLCRKKAQKAPQRFVLFVPFVATFRMPYSRLELNGKVAVVVGGTSGIGRAIAHGFAEAGADVVPTSRRAEQVETVAREIEQLGRRSLRLTSDVSDRASLERVLGETLGAFGKVNILVNSAGRTKRAPTLDFPEDDWNDIIDTNLTGTLRACQVFGRHMLESGSGSIINIASLSTFVALHEVAAYSASKAAVGSLTKSLAVEWSSRGVRVNAIAPGVFRTALNQKLLDETERGREFLVRTPMKRFGNVDELAGVAIFLASDAASFVTGEIIAVDGGFLASGVNQ